MFYEVFSSFAGDVNLAMHYRVTEDHIDDPKFKDICKEYVAMLNKMPDNNLTLCSRYAMKRTLYLSLLNMMMRRMSIRKIHIQVAEIIIDIRFS
jgi:hypothetical protein